MRQGKDILAVGNITGAMAFQSTIPVALGLLLTDWDLDRYAIAAGVAGIAGAALALYALPRHRLSALHAAIWGALFVASSRSPRSRNTPAKGCQRAASVP